MIQIKKINVKRIKLGKVPAKQVRNFDRSPTPE